jgi:cell division protein FtsX
VYVLINSIHTIYPYWQGGIKGGNRDALIQALFQLGGLVVAIVSAIFGGMLTGIYIVVFTNTLENTHNINGFDGNMQISSTFNLQ